MLFHSAALDSLEALYPDRADVQAPGSGTNATGQRVANVPQTIAGLSGLPCQVAPTQTRDSETAGGPINSRTQNRIALRIAFLHQHPITTSQLISIAVGAHAGTYNVTGVSSDALGLQTVCEVEKL